LVWPTLVAALGFSCRRKKLNEGFSKPTQNTANQLRSTILNTVTGMYLLFGIK